MGLRLGGKKADGRDDGLMAGRQLGLMAGRQLGLGSGRSGCHTCRQGWRLLVRIVGCTVEFLCACMPRESVESSELRVGTCIHGWRLLVRIVGCTVEFLCACMPRESVESSELRVWTVTRVATSSYR